MQRAQGAVGVHLQILFQRSFLFFCLPPLGLKFSEAKVFLWFRSLEGRVGGWLAPVHFFGGGVTVAASGGTKAENLLEFSIEKHIGVIVTDVRPVNSYGLSQVVEGPPVVARENVRVVVRAGFGVAHH